MLGLTGVEDRGDHQVPRHLHGPPYPSPARRGPVGRVASIGHWAPGRPDGMCPEWGKTAGVDTVRLTQYAHGGGCACKIPPGELEDMVRGLTGIAVADRLAVLATADFFTPVVDDAYDWGRIAAANALSDIYAMGGRPVLAVNLLGWPRDVLPPELAAEVLRGGLDVARLAGCPVAGGHSIDDPEPKYGMAVTGVA